MKKLILTAAIASSCGFNAYAADSIDISVIGTISPAACVPLAAGGGVIDYGFISPSQLAETGPTVLEAKTLGFSIACSADINVAVRGVSNRPSTTTDIKSNEGPTGGAVVTDELIAAGLGKNLPLGLPDITIPTVSGLGKSSNGQNIGGYTLTLPFTTVSLNGEPAAAKFYTISSASPTAATEWQRNTSIAKNGDALVSDSSAYYSYSTQKDDVRPEPFKELTGTLVIQAYVTDKSNLDLSQPVNMDGSTTIELYYF